MNPARSVAPAVEPVSLALAKSYCRVDASTDDDLITLLIQAAREYVEEYTGNTLIQSTWQWTLHDWTNSRIIRPSGQWYDWNGDSSGILYIPNSPVISISSITYYDTAGTLQTLSAASYQTQIKSNPGRLMPASGYVWPDIQSDNLSAITIQYVAGYGTQPENIPGEYRLAMLYLIVQWYEERKPTAFTTVNQVPLTVVDLLKTVRYG